MFSLPMEYYQPIYEMPDLQYKHPDYRSTICNGTTNCTAANDYGICHGKE